MSADPEPEVLTLAEAAALLRIGRTTAYALARDGALPGCRMIGGVYRVSRRALLASMEEAAGTCGDGTTPATRRHHANTGHRRKSVSSFVGAKHPRSQE